MIPSVVVATPIPSPPVIYTSPPTASLAAPEGVEVEMPTAPWPEGVVEEVEMVKMAKVLEALVVVAKVKAFSILLVRVVVA